MIRAFQWDLARQVERLDWLLAQLPRYADWGYQELHLHLEDAVDYPSLPGVARRDASAWRQFTRLVESAHKVGIHVVPIVNLLGHTQYLIKHPDYRDLNELRADDGSPLPVGQICPVHPRTLQVAEKLFTDVAPLATSQKLHVGLDESFHLGRHPDSRREISEVGLAGHFARHVCRLADRIEAHGLRPAIWADMLVMLPEAINQLPSGLVAYDWYYHAFRRHPRFELYNFTEYNLAPALKKKNVGYFGCAMNGAFRQEPMPIFGERLANAMAWWRRCKSKGAEGFLVSSWEPGHLAMELTTVVDAAIAGLWLEPAASHDHASLLRRGFERVYGKNRAAESSRIALACDDRAFAGYARWEIERHWDASLGRIGPSRAAAEQRYFRRLKSKKLPPSFAASIGWRSYLAERDVFVKNTARGVMRARRLVHRSKVIELEKLFDELGAATEAFAVLQRQAATDANAMWAGSRRANQTNPNLINLRADRTRLRTWRKWLLRARRNPVHLSEPSPIAGRWQLNLLVHNVRPGAQLLVVQRRNAEGLWEDVRSRHTIEFRTTAARRRSQIKREWSVPLENPDDPLRIVLRGIGEVAISDLVLTDGITKKTNRAWPIARRRRLGSPAPSAGWVDLDWTVNADSAELGF